MRSPTKYAPTTVAAITLLLATAASATERGTPAEAQALLDKSVQHYLQVGPDQAFADFRDPNSSYRDRDLYVWCVDKADTVVFHATTPALIGKDTKNVPDADRNLFAPPLTRAAFVNGTATTDYKWVNPLSSKIEPKVALARRVSDDLVCVVGYYK